MSPWLTFVVGVIVGLLVGWMLDLFYRRRTEAQPEVTSSAARQPEWAVPLPEAPVEPVSPGAAAPAAVAAVAAVAAEELREPETTLLPAEPEPPATAVEAELPTSPVEAERLHEVEAPEQQPDWPELSERVGEVAETEGELPASAPHIADALPVAEAGLPPAAVAALAASEAGRAGEEPAADTRDKLIVIEGIGPVYEARLHAAGINTFRQLIAAGPDRLREIIQPQGWQRINFDEWIEQAHLLEEGKDEELKALQARLFRRKA